MLVFCLGLLFQEDKALLKVPFRHLQHAVACP
jgi:hypothetical protein